MTKIILPDNLDTKTWASGGIKTDPGSSKYSEGWTPEIPTPAHENYIQGRQDEAIANMVQNGIPEWNRTVTYNKGSLAIQGGITVTSLTNNNIGNTPSVAAGASDTNWTRIDQYRDANTQTFADANLRYVLADDNSAVLNKDFSNVGTVSNTDKATLGNSVGAIDGTAGALVGYDTNGSIVLNEAVNKTQAADSVIVGVGNTNRELKAVEKADIPDVLGIHTMFPDPTKAFTNLNNIPLVNITAAAQLDTCRQTGFYYMVFTGTSSSPFGTNKACYMKVITRNNSTLQELTNVFTQVTLKRQTLDLGATWIQWWGYKLDYDFGDAYPNPYNPFGTDSGPASGVHINPDHPNGSSGGSRIKDGEPLLNLRMSYEETGINSLHIYGGFNLDVPARWSTRTVPGTTEPIKVLGAWLPFSDYNKATNKLIEDSAPFVTLGASIQTTVAGIPSIAAFYTYSNSFQFTNGYIDVIIDKAGMPINCMWVALQEQGANASGINMSFNITVTGLSKRS